MLKSDIAKQYAQALFQVSTNSQELEQELKIVFKALSNEEIRIFFESPKFSASTKKKLLKTSLKENISEIALNFLSVLIDKRREGFLNEILEALQKYNNQKFGKIKAKVKVAKELDETKLIEAVQKTIRENASKFGYKEDSINQIEVKAHVQPEILGGAEIQVDDRLWDGSVLTHLRKWESNIRKNRINQAKLFSGGQL